MAATAANLKFSKQHLLKTVLELSRNSMEDIRVTEIQNCKNSSVSISKMAATATILKFYKQHLLPNRKSDWAETRWEASEWHKDLELRKSFRSNIQKWYKDPELPKSSRFDIQNDIPRAVIRIVPKSYGSRQSDIEIQNC